MTKKRRVKDNKSFSFELNINNDKLKKRNKYRRKKSSKKKKLTKRNNRKVKTLPEETIAWTIKGGKRKTSKKRKTLKKK